MRICVLRTLKSTCTRTIHNSQQGTRRLQRSEVYLYERPLPGRLTMDRVSSNLLMNKATPRPLAEIPSWCRRLSLVDGTLGRDRRVFLSLRTR